MIKRKSSGWTSVTAECGLEFSMNGENILNVIFIHILDEKKGSKII